jgi:hypothetical protein
MLAMQHIGRHSVDVTTYAAAVDRADPLGRHRR